jgi:hypothetical protein
VISGFAPDLLSAHFACGSERPVFSLQGAVVSLPARIGEAVDLRAFLPGIASEGEGSVEVQRIGPVHRVVHRTRKKRLAQVNLELLRRGSLLARRSIACHREVEIQFQRVLEGLRGGEGGFALARGCSGVHGGILRDVLHKSGRVDVEILCVIKIHVLAHNGVHSSARSIHEARDRGS